MAKKLEKVGKTITGLELKFEVLLVYLLSFLGFIFAFMKDEKVSEDARFHYKQSGATFVVYVTLGILEGILGSFAAMFAFTPLFGISILFGILIGLLGLVEVAVIVFSIITIVKAFYNQKFEIPFMNKISDLIWKK